MDARLIPILQHCDITEGEFLNSIPAVFYASRNGNTILLSVLYANDTVIFEVNVRTSTDFLCSS